MSLARWVIILSTIKNLHNPRTSDRYTGSSPAAADHTASHFPACLSVSADECQYVGPLVLSLPPLPPEVLSEGHHHLHM